MKITDIKTLGIIGSGTMGSGIAISASLNGFITLVYDLSDVIILKSKSKIESELKKSLDRKKISEKDKDEAISRLKYSPEFGDLSDCDFIIEAASEEIKIKKDIFERLDTVCKADAILSTNTSSLSVTYISSFTKVHRRKVIGMHFFNPANIMKLVEVIKGKFTDEETVETTRLLAEKLKKIPVTAEDTPAFIVNRIARPYYGEALKILAEGSSDPETIDKVMKNCGNFAMGPFELMDLIGIDINFAVTKSVFEAFFYDPKYRPSYIQKKMVDSGLLGRKTKQGFYNYD